MARSIPALVEPSILLWARKSAGLDVPQVARKLGKMFDPEKVVGWEAGVEFFNHPELFAIRKREGVEGLA